MKIVFKSLKIKNFKGFENREFIFDDGTNVITGRNGSGKSDTLDAITWVLFGKDMNDRTDFDVIPFDKSNRILDVNPEVTLVIFIDGTIRELKRVLKRRNTETFIDGVPCKKISDYNDYISSLLGTHDNFKMFTNPFYYTEQLHWTEQRAQLMQFFPQPENEEVLMKGDFSQDFKNELEQRTVEDINIVYQARKKELKELKITLQAKIEALKETASVKIENMDGAESERDALRKKVETIDKQVVEISTENSRIARRKIEIQSVIQSADQKISRIKMNAEDQMKKAIQSLDFLIKNIENERVQLGKEWFAIKNPDVICPTCGQELPADKKDEVIQDTERRKKEIDVKGRKLSEEINSLKKEREKIEAQGIDISEQVAEINIGVLEAKKELKTLPEPKLIPSVSREEVEKLNYLNSALAKKDVINESKAKVEMFENDLSKTFADLEKCEDMIKAAAEFMYCRSEIVINQVNEQFDGLTVKILETQKNGVEKECFEIIKDGKPYRSLNSAMKLEVGIEFIEFIKRNRDIHAPIIIDNTESYCDYDFSKINSQIIATKAIEGAELQLKTTSPSKVIA